MSSKGKALEKSKNKAAGKAIASMHSYYASLRKRDPTSYSYPFHQDKAISKKYPEQMKHYKEKRYPLK